MLNPKGSKTAIYDGWKEMDGYMRENKRYAMIAIGCTGGKHRSVAVVARIAELLSELDDVAVSVKHRDLGKE